MTFGSESHLKIKLDFDAALPKRQPAITLFTVSSNCADVCAIGGHHYLFLLIENALLWGRAQRGPKQHYVINSFLKYESYYSSSHSKQFGSRFHVHISNYIWQWLCLLELASVGGCLKAVKCIPMLFRDSKFSSFLRYLSEYRFSFA